MWARIYLMFFVTIIMEIKQLVTLEVGETCVPNNDVTDGVCTLITNCDIALRAIRQKNYHLFKRCSFVGDLEVVCCPTTTTTKFGPDEKMTTERKSETECKKIMASTTVPLDLHIIGGEAASIGEFRHMVAVGYDGDNGYQFDCGGALVSTTYVLTAAHCIINLERKFPKIIRAGVVDIGSPEWNEETDYRVVMNITHPEYRRSAQYHDIALLRLERPVEISSYLNAACLYTSTSNPSDNLTIIGWGKTSTTRSERSSLLLKTTVIAASRRDCEPNYKNYRKLPRGIIDEQMCAGDPQGGHDACQGDSGAPIQMIVGDELVHRLVGVTSFGSGCGTKVPGIYTRVASYLDWIESIVWPN